MSHTQEFTSFERTLERLEKKAKNDIADRMVREECAEVQKRLLALAKVFSQALKERRDAKTRIVYGR